MKFNFFVTLSGARPSPEIDTISAPIRVRDPIILFIGRFRRDPRLIEY